MGQVPGRHGVPGVSPREGPRVALQQRVLQHDRGRRLLGRGDAVRRSQGAAAVDRRDGVGEAGELPAGPLQGHLRAGGRQGTVPRGRADHAPRRHGRRRSGKSTQILLPN